MVCWLLRRTSTTYKLHLCKGECVDLLCDRTIHHLGIIRFKPLILITMTTTHSTNNKTTINLRSLAESARLGEVTPQDVEVKKLFISALYAALSIAVPMEEIGPDLEWTSDDGITIKFHTSTARIYLHKIDGSILMHPVHGTSLYPPADWFFFKTIAELGRMLHRLETYSL